MRENRGLEKYEFTKDTKESYCRGTDSFEKEKNFLKTPIV